MNAKGQRVLGAFKSSGTMLFPKRFVAGELLAEAADATESLESSELGYDCDNTKVGSKAHSTQE